MALSLAQKTGLLGLVSNQILETDQEINTLQERLRSIQDHMILAIAHQPGEDGPSAHDRDLAISQLYHFQKRREALVSARIGLESGKYSGKCSGCKNAIDFERLKAVPETTLCIDCATKRR